MRIIYLHQYFNTPEDTGSTRSFELASRLVTAGHEVIMITTDHARRRQGFRGWYISEEAGIEIHRFAVPYSHLMSYTQRVRSFLRFAFGAALRAASIKADIVFATSTPLTIAIPGVFASKRQHIPLVFEVRDLWPEVPIAMGILRAKPLIVAARWLEKFAYQNSKQVVALSPDMKNVIAEVGYPAEYIHVIPNGADQSFFAVSEACGQEFRRQFDWLGDRPLLVYAGTMGRVNGVAYMVKLAAAMQDYDSEVRFLVVGSGVEKQKTIDLAKELGVYEKSFFIIPPVPKREILEILSAADIAVSLVVDLPALWANSANKFFEAMATGTPLAINYRGWQAEVLESSGAGIVLPASDVDLAARKLADLLKDRTWLKQAQISAKTIARRYYSWDLLADQLREVLQSAVEESINQP